ncbi:MAG TPA: hypothetical protein VL551_28170 [Actinospica sp.]|nr:hypothetical protein [Actinospica sp.]
MLRLEGTVNGERVSEECHTADTLVLAAAASLPGSLDGNRLLYILATLRSAALSGRTWGWSGEGFTLTLYRQRDEWD